MLAAIASLFSLPFRSTRSVAAYAVGAAAVAGIALYALTRKKIDPEEIERQRRDLLANTGRITDGTITDPFLQTGEGAERRIIVYNYRIAGVSYECAQDVTTLTEHVHDIRADLPVQVRYDPHNPGNSIIVAEVWSGLRLATHAIDVAPTPDRNSTAL
ncbi:MAG TPA: hypothetical protein VFE38_14270 [Edaphobacter sp.]|nr:hypothetical protein [Edaphobacter sp.]